MARSQKNALPCTSRQKQEHDTRPRVIIGIGASAGGLEALEKFFTAMPADSGVAFIVVTHLDPHHDSLLPALLARKTTMTVQLAEHNMRVIPDHVYVIPPAKELTVSRGKLHVVDIQNHLETRHLVDTFLRSLAQDQKERAIGIILSGTGTDGSLGVRTIKGEAGMVMAQDIQSAEYAGMPESAIATGLVDFVLPPHQMPAQLLDYVGHQAKEECTLLLSDSDSIENAMKSIFQILKSETHHDFSLYKKNTINRRIERRLHVLQIDSLEDYVQYLYNSKHEISVLFRELLIGVTSFFRDPEAFDALKNIYLPEILGQQTDEHQVRVWVVGCSTGEEAYSVAMILSECMERIERHFEVQIFGTDLDEKAISIARKGIYPDSISADVSKERLDRFFTKKDNHYQVKKSLREMVIFAQQNVIKDPPFTKLDILCCRNLLIYFGLELQKKLMPIFHYSLRYPGILFLGSSETVGHSTDLFHPLDKKYKIFKRISRDTSPQSLLQMKNSIPLPTMTDNRTQISQNSLHNPSNARLLKTILAQSDMPSCVIVDDRADIIYIHGRTGRFLEPAEGKASLNLLKMARPDLRSALTNAFHTTVDEGMEIRVDDIELNEDEQRVHLNIIIRPLSDFELGRGMLLVIFEEIHTEKDQKPSSTAVRRSKKQISEIKRLEDKLLFTRENLQTTIEELETSNEELKSTNEELQSTNEELQSTNEELETSKEELQSLNEESATVNAELQSRVDELVAANDDIRNLLDSTDIATIFLDTHFNIRKFTSKLTDIFPLASTDSGRPIRHFVSNLKNVDIQHYAEKVLKDLGKISTEVLDIHDNVYRMRLKPYRTAGNMIDGIVITFEDITELKRLLEKEKRLATVVKDSNDAITLQDLDGNILAWNRGAEKMFGYKEAEALNMNILEISPPHCHDDLKILYTALLDKEVESFLTERVDKNGKCINVWLTITRLFDDMGKPEFIATTERNVTKMQA